MRLELLQKLLDDLKKVHLDNFLVHLISIGYWFYFKTRNNITLKNSQYLPSKNNPRFILAGNHASAADAYLIFGLISGKYHRRVYAVAHERSWKKNTLERTLLQFFKMIRREGSGQQVVMKMVEYLLQNRTIVIPPEGMTSNHVMKGFTGVMRVYYYANRLLLRRQQKTNSSVDLTKPIIPIIPIASIGAHHAYPIGPGTDGKYHMAKTGIVGVLGKPLLYKLPVTPDSKWFREKTDDLMERIAELAGQNKVITSWKLDQVKSQKKRIYRV